VLRKRGAETAGRRRTGAGGGVPRDDDGVPVAGVPEDGGEVARKLPRDDVVLVVCLAEAKRRWSGGTTARPSDGGARAHRRCGLGYSSELLLASRWARGARGNGGATWSGEERASVGRVSGERGAGGARGAEKSGAGQLGLGKAAGEGGSQAQRETERGRGWRLKTGTCLQFFKNAGTPV
jgi:hypothetical protein